MSFGYRFKCQKCGRTYEALWGDDPLLPGFVEDCRQELREGKYGPKRQKLMREHPDLLMDSTEHLYVCRNCGNWIVERNMGLYVPKVPHPREVWWAGNLKEEYQMISRPYHKCGKCGSRMHIEKDGSQLKCPDCGAVNTGTFVEEQMCY